MRTLCLHAQDAVSLHNAVLRRKRVQMRKHDIVKGNGSLTTCDTLPREVVDMIW